MTFEEGLVAFLSADTAVLSLVGQGDWVRIFPQIVPQKESALKQVPCLVYTTSAETRSRSFCGTNNLVLTSLELDCYAITLLGARALSSAVRAVLVDHRGTMGDVKVRDVSLESSTTLHDVDPGLFRVVDTYNVWIEEE